MNTPMRPSPRHVPTLTEVIDLPDALAAPESVSEALVDVPTEGVVVDVLVAESVSPDGVPVLAAEPFSASPHVPVPAPVVSEPPRPSPPSDLHDASIPRAMLVDRGLERPAFARTVPGDLSQPLPGALSTANSVPIPTPAPPAAAGLSGATLEAQIAQRVMADLQRQIDGMLEYRLRETLAPILARTSEALVRELRQELSKTMKDVVARSVAQEVARQRSRG